MNNLSTTDELKELEAEMKLKLQQIKDQIKIQSQVKEYLPFEKTDDENKFKFTDKNDYIKYLNKNPDIRNKFIESQFNSFIYNNFDKSVFEIKKKRSNNSSGTDTKKNSTSTLDNDDMETAKGKNRCYAMTANCVKTGINRARCGCETYEGKFCVRHSNNMFKDKQLCNYGLFGVSGKNAMPSTDIYKKYNITDEGKGELIMKDEKDILYITPIHKNILDLHYKLYSDGVAMVIGGDFVSFDEYINKIKMTDADRKLLNTFYKPEDYPPNIEEEDEDESESEEPESEESEEDNDIKIKLDKIGIERKEIESLLITNIEKYSKTDKTKGLKKKGKEIQKELDERLLSLDKEIAELYK